MAALKIYPLGFSETQFQLVDTPIQGTHDGVRDGNMFYCVLKRNGNISSTLIPNPVKFKISDDPMTGFEQVSVKIVGNSCQIIRYSPKLTP
jgi:hypothetical protein